MCFLCGVLLIWACAKSVILLGIQYLLKLFSVPDQTMAASNLVDWPVSFHSVQQKLKPSYVFPLALLPSEAEHWKKASTFRAE